MTAAPTTLPLCGIAIIEQDMHGDATLVWQYPNLAALHPHLEAVLMRRCPLVAKQYHPQGQGDSAIFSFHKFHERWIYSITAAAAAAGTEMGETARRLVARDPHVVGYSIAVVAMDFNPEKYAAMTRHFSDVYTSSQPSSSNSSSSSSSTDVDQSGDSHMVAVLREYLHIFATDRSSSSSSSDQHHPRSSSFSARDFDPRRALVHAPLQLLLDTVGLDHTMTLWTAMMLKKRVMVVSGGGSPHLLQQVVRCIPTLVWHRSPAVFSTLRPLVDLSHEPERQDLAQMGAFVAGSLDVGAKSDPRRYDVLVDLGSRQVIVPDGALREDMKPNRLHRAIAQTVEQFRGQGPAQLLKQLALRTREILLQLEQLRGDGDAAAMLTLEQLRSLGQPREVERLLFNIAVCENMAQV